MVPALTVKRVTVVEAQAIKDNTEFVGSKGSTPVSIDTFGYDWLTVVVWFGAMDIAMATMKLYSSDDDGTYTARANYATSPATLPSASDDHHFFEFQVDKRAMPYRYWQVELIPGDGSAGTYGVCWAELSRPKILPGSVSDRGATQAIAI